MPITILLADDHETVRHGLKLLIEAQEDMTVVGEAGDGAAAVALAEARHPDVVILDLSMPQVNGLEGARLMKERAPSTSIVALTRHDDEAYVAELFRAGALGYVLKQSASSELLRAVRSAAVGERYLDPALGQAPVAAGDKAPYGRAPLTNRESEVLRLVATGHSNKEVAAELKLSVKTIEVHKANASRKIGLRGRTDLIKYALLHGWLRDS
jgi:two-component system, NarL family, response regulator NreC